MNAARSREARRTEGPSTRPPPLSTPAGEAQGWSRSPFPAQVLTSHVTSGGGSAHHARSRPSGCCWASLFLTNGSGGDGCRRSPRACAQIRGAALFSSSELRASGGTGTTRSARQPGGGRPRALGPKSAESRPRTLSAAGPQAQTQAPAPRWGRPGPRSADCWEERDAAERPTRDATRARLSPQGGVSLHTTVPRGAPRYAKRSRAVAAPVPHTRPCAPRQTHVGSGKRMLGEPPSVAPTQGLQRPRGAFGGLPPPACSLPPRPQSTAHRRSRQPQRGLASLTGPSLGEPQGRELDEWQVPDQCRAGNRGAETGGAVSPAQPDPAGSKPAADARLPYGLPQGAGISVPRPTWSSKVPQCGSTLRTGDAAAA